MPRYAWPEDLTERGARWQDCYAPVTLGRKWLHSSLWAKDGTLIAMCIVHEAGEGVKWSTEFGDEGQCETRAEATREARKEARRFLSQNSDS